MKAFFKDIWNNYRHALFFLYAFIYLPWFAYLEDHVAHFHVVHMVIDDYIPFIEYFIVPYLFWFVYMAIGGLYFFLYDVKTFKKLAIFLITGMTVFLIISTIYPNGAYLRPVTFERNNIFVDAVRWLYSIDTPTNLFPSIHVYNSIGIHLAVINSAKLKNNKFITQASGVTMVLIILSTMFLKQHSLFDVLTALVMAGLMWALVYAPQVGRNRSSRPGWHTDYMD